MVPPPHQTVKLLSAVPPLHTKAEMCSFLGMTNYCSHWIHGYTAVNFVFYAATLCTWTHSINWKHDICIERLEGCAHIRTSFGLATLWSAFSSICARDKQLHLGHVGHTPSQPPNHSTRNSCSKSGYNVTVLFSSDISVHRARLHVQLHCSYWLTLIITHDCETLVDTVTLPRADCKQTPITNSTCLYFGWGPDSHHFHWFTICIWCDLLL